MDFSINLESLSGKKTEFEGLKSNVSQISEENSSGYFSKISGTEIGSLVTKINNSVTRLKKGYENSDSWLGRYVKDITEVEEDLSNFESSGASKPTEFKSEFIDIFSKQVIPTLKTKAETPATEESTADLTDLEAKKKAFAGDVNNSSQFYIDPNYRTKLAHMTCFDNTTGEILKDGDVLTLKPGETRILTVKLPDYCGEIDHVFRTTAQADYSGVISNRCDIDPDPNRIDYIRWEPGNPKRQFHYPASNVSTKFNTYDWIITANRDGTFLASQTCEFQSHGADSSGRQYKYSGKKAMVAINVVVKQ